MGASKLAEERRLSQPTGKPVGIFRAIGTAHRTTWRSPQLYVLVVGAMQLLVLVIAIPVIRLLYQLVLVQTGLGSIAYDRISHVLRNPLADVTLLLIAVVAVVTIMAELITLFVLASHHQDGDATSFRLMLHQVWETIKKLVHPQGLLMVIYLILLLPLGQLGLTTILTKKVAVPPFVSEELSKSGSGSLLYGAFLLVVFYLNVRLLFTLPLLGTTTAGVWEAFVTSWRLTRRRSLRIVGLLIVVSIPAGLAIIPTGRVDDHANDRHRPAGTCCLSVDGRRWTQCLADRHLCDHGTAHDHDRPIADRDDARLARSDCPKVIDTPRSLFLTQSRHTSPSGVAMCSGACRRW